jgi:hypothetical protein
MGDLLLAEHMPCLSALLDPRRLQRLFESSIALLLLERSP